MSGANPLTRTQRMSCSQSRSHAALRLQQFINLTICKYISSSGISTTECFLPVALSAKTFEEVRHPARVSQGVRSSRMLPCQRQDARGREFTNPGVRVIQQRQ